MVESFSLQKEQLIQQDHNSHILSHKLKVCIIGATGAVGKEMVRYAKVNPNVEEITLIVRKVLPEWENISQSGCKVNFICKEDFSNLSDCVEKLQDYEIFLCALGTLRKYGIANFIRVDHDYPVEFAKLASKCKNVQYFGLISAQGSNAKSCLLYPKTKGRAENDVGSMHNFKYYSIFRPGLLVNRDNDVRCMERFFACLPCVPRVTARRVGQVAVEDAIQKLINKNEAKQQEGRVIISHSQIHRLARQYQLP
eukprot:403372327